MEATVIQITAERARQYLEAFFHDYTGPGFSVTLWDESRIQFPSESEVVVTFNLRSQRLLSKAALYPSMLVLGRAFVEGNLEINGDIKQAFYAIDHLFSKLRTRQWRFRRGVASIVEPFLSQLSKVKNEAQISGKAMSRARTKGAVQFHYDLPPDFFSLWLDKKLVYSGAYFTSPDQSLDEAQTQKLDHICRKLQLRERDSFLDCGCGWGALIVHAAAEYGVLATGVTLSKNQFEYSSRRILDLNLMGQCAVLERDFRNLDTSGQYDKIASIGMVEHVLEPHLPQFYQQMYNLLRPGGLMLVQAISSSKHTPLRGGPSFMDNFIFPDSEIVPISTTLNLAEDSGFEVRDVENMREHYAVTLSSWLDNLQKNSGEIIESTNIQTYRMFSAYLAGACHDMSIGRTGLYQTLLQRPALQRPPLTSSRYAVYGNPPDSERAR